MSGRCCHASGIIVMIDSGRLRPVMSRNSSTLSKLPESEQLGSMIGKSFSSSSPNSSERSTPSRAFIQLQLPSRVLISPLWHMARLGWARSHDGKVFVEKRECTIAMWDS